MAPLAFAASGSAGVQYNTRTINVGSGYTVLVEGVAAKDANTMTEFLPIYYLNQGLRKLGYKVNWNGNASVLSITTPAGVKVTAPAATVGIPGPNQMVIPTFNWHLTSWLKIRFPASTQPMYPFST